MKRLIGLCLILVLSLTSGAALADKGKKPRKGLNPQAMQELHVAGVDKYLGQFTPVASMDVGDGWTKHTFDPDDGDGPICIAGTPFSVFTREGNPSRLLIFEQGGGACWQNAYNCNVLAEAQEPPGDDPLLGIWEFDRKDNPFADYSIVYMPYCDGSVFTGDNTVFSDYAWQAFIAAQLGLPSDAVPPIRFHRGMRNQSAGMDVARAMFPHARRITVAGSSAGGVGASGFAPFLVRFLYGNQVKLTVFNDAGPVTVDLGGMADLGTRNTPILGNTIPDVEDRANDWQFGQFFPANCMDCDDMGQNTAIINWRLDNDSTIREAFYETDGDITNRFFLGLLLDPVGFRDLIISEHGLINAAHPDRYNRFIVAGDTSHTALQSPLFYSQDANGVHLNEWTRNFLKGKKKKWADIVEDAVP